MPSPVLSTIHYQPCDLPNNSMRKGVCVPALIGQIRKLRGEVNCSRSHSWSECEEPSPIPNILPRVPALTTVPPTPMAQTWRLSNLLISCTPLVAHGPFLLWQSVIVIACIYVCLWLLEKGLHDQPCPPAQCGSLAPGRHKVNTCGMTVPTVSPRREALRSHVSLVVLTCITLTATIGGRPCPILILQMKVPRGEVSCSRSQVGEPQVSNVSEPVTEVWLMILNLSQTRVACRPFKCLLLHAFDIFVTRSVLFCTICSGNFILKLSNMQKVERSVWTLIYTHYLGL